MSVKLTYEEALDELIDYIINIGLNNELNSIGVCNKCNYHSRISYKERIDLLCDNGTFKELYKDIEPGSHILVNDGAIDLVVRSIEDQTIITYCLNTGKVKHR